MILSIGFMFYLGDAITHHTSDMTWHPITWVMFQQVPHQVNSCTKIPGGHFFCHETTTFDDWESLQEAGGKKVRADVLIRKIQERNATSRMWKTWTYMIFLPMMNLKRDNIPKMWDILATHLELSCEICWCFIRPIYGMQGTPGWWRGRGGRRWRGRESTSRWGLVESWGDTDSI